VWLEGLSKLKKFRLVACYKYVLYNFYVTLVCHAKANIQLDGNVEQGTKKGIKKLCLKISSKETA
jgi:hypothetical protein